MDKSAIKNFAIQARKDLLAGVKQKAYEYGICEKTAGSESLTGSFMNGRILTSEEQLQRNELLNLIRTKGYDQVMEEVAYTWFNRFIALRFMEVNEYLPSRIRVFTNDKKEFQPEILSEALHLDLENLDKAKVIKLLEVNQTEELYKYLLIILCNDLNSALPEMFEKIQNYTEILFPNNLLKVGSVLDHLVRDIFEEDWKDAVQIIGWLYQYYNTELKDETFGLLKKNIKITKERIPAVTQLFTPDWIVRYMVENSLGRLWIEGHPSNSLKSNWKYYLDELEQEPEVVTQLDKIRAGYAKIKPEEIKVIDPCMGSGHILVYAFEVLMQIYISDGWDQRDAAQYILTNNIYGLDIDSRAAQLAYFALMMKARQYDRRIFSRGIQPRVYSLVESNGLEREAIMYFVNEDEKLKKDFCNIVTQMRDAKEYGSIINISEVNFPAIFARLEEMQRDINIYHEVVVRDIMPMIRVAEVIAQKYDIVITNPPYVGSKGFSPRLSSYIEATFPDSKSDLFAVLLERCLSFQRQTGFSALVTPTSWMYNPRFEILRKKLCDRVDVCSLCELGDDAFESGFGTVMYVFQKQIANGKYVGKYYDVSGNTEKSNFINSKVYQTCADYFRSFDSCKYSYKISAPYRNILHNAKKLNHFGQARSGIQTNDNARFVHEWFEVSYAKIEFNHKPNTSTKAKWFPHVKGGSYRKWYGNMGSVINWENDGLEIISLAKQLYGSYTRTVKSMEYYFCEGLTWSHTTYSQPFALRYMSEGTIFNVEGPSVFDLGKKQNYILGLLNSVVTYAIFSKLTSSIHYLAGEMANFPILVSLSNEIDQYVEENINISKLDWDSFETAWDFKCHPLSENNHFMEQENSYSSDSFETSIRAVYLRWKARSELQFQILKSNEEKLNRIFIEIYGLQDELTPEVQDKDVTIRKADLARDIRSFISYTVGCMFGRYSLDFKGLSYAGGKWDGSKYRNFIPDNDNIIPISENIYFKDDIVSKFVDIVKVIYREEKLEENLQFIADALGNKGDSSRDVIRNYFIDDFYNDHCKIYSATGSGKRPIYWLFDSGKKNGFKALIYMHRYQPDLLSTMRTDYVHEQQERYRTQLQHLEASIVHASPADQAKISKQIGKLKEQSLELLAYEEKIHHLADQMIDIDLDDGVKVNYAKFQDVLAPIK